MDPATLAFILSTVSKIGSVGISRKRKRKLKRYIEKHYGAELQRLGINVEQLIAQQKKAKRVTKEAVAARGFAGTPYQRARKKEIEQEYEWRLRDIEIQKDILYYRKKMQKLSQPTFWEEFFSGVSKTDFTPLFTEWQAEPIPKVEVETAGYKGAAPTSLYPYSEPSLA